MVRDIDLFIEGEESFGVNRPMWGQRVKLDRCDGVRLEQGLDVGVEFLGVHNACASEDRDREECCLEG